MIIREEVLGSSGVADRRAESVTQTGRLSQEVAAEKTGGRLYGCMRRSELVAVCNGVCCRKLR